MQNHPMRHNTLPGPQPHVQYFYPPPPAMSQALPTNNKAPPHYMQQPMYYYPPNYMMYTPSPQAVNMNIPNVHTPSGPYAPPPMPPQNLMFNPYMYQQQPRHPMMKASAPFSSTAPPIPMVKKAKVPLKEKVEDFLPNTNTTVADEGETDDESSAHGEREVQEHLI